MPEELTCPLLKGPCVRGACAWWAVLKGHHPQTDAPIDHGGCAMAWLPVLLIEGTQQTRQVAAAVESTRNEIVEQPAKAAQAQLKATLLKQLMAGG